MEIIKHGNLHVADVHFTCNICGCEFIASINEYKLLKYYYDNNKFCASCRCPTCEKEVTGEGEMKL